MPHSAGLASEANDPRSRPRCPASAPHFSNPVALFNNIFWDNQAYMLDRFGPGATLSPTTLVAGGYIDFEVPRHHERRRTRSRRGSPTSPTARSSAPDGALHAVAGGQGNTVGADPGFVQPFVDELTVGGSRLDPQAAAVTITGADPPVGLTGNYHIALPALGWPGSWPPRRRR